MKILLLLALFFALSGCGFVWAASTKRTKLHPYHSNCDNVFFLKRKSWYTPKGFQFHVTGYLLLGAAGLLNSLYFFLN